MNVPLLDVTKQNAPLYDELMAAAEAVIRSGRYIGGPEVEGLEQEIAEFCGANNAVAVSSGTDALLLALMTLGIGPGDEVICPAFTFFATAGSIARTGATPVFADVCPTCFNLDPEVIAPLLTERTAAIMPVHLFGQCAEMDPLLEIAKAHGLKIIEDGAQALGASSRGRGAGSIGDMGAFSFYPSKNLGGFGDAGILTIADPDLAKRARALRNHGCEERYFHHSIGGNFRCDPLQAALLRVKLPHLTHYNQQRGVNAARYTALLKDLPGIQQSDPASCCGGESEASNPAEEANLILPSALPHGDPIWNQYTLRVLGEGRRDTLRSQLIEKGIGAEIYYPLTLDRQACFQHLKQEGDHLAVSHRLSAECLSLPNYPELSSEQLEHIRDAIGDFQMEKA